MRRTKAEIEKAKAEHAKKQRGRPRKEDRQQLTVYLPRDLADDLRDYAEQQGRTMSGQIEVMVRNLLSTK